MRVEVAGQLRPREAEQGEHAERSELRVIFASTPMCVRDALKSTMEGMDHLGLNDDEMSTVELVLAEVMNNVVEHAYKDSRDGVIELRITHDANGLSCAVLDDGHEMPNGTAPHGHPPEPDVPLPLQPEGGFGWFLIRTLASDLCYERNTGRNCLSFRLPVARGLRAS